MEQRPTDRGVSDGGTAWGRIVDQILRRRYVIYIVFVVGLVAWRFWPTLTPTIRKVPGIEKRAGGGIVISGTDNAPGLLMESVVQFKSDYPKVDVQLEGGGTVHALEDLLNRRAAVAALSRPPTARERKIAGDRSDSLLYYPVALGGIVILAPRASGLDAVALDDVRSLVIGEPTDLFRARGIARIYGPDPNSGLWEALLERLGYTGVLPPRYVPLATGQLVLEAVRQDAHSVGFASDLTFELPADDPAIVELRVGDSAESAAAPTKANLVEGGYPLYHHLYLCTTAVSDVLAGGFVTYYTQPTGQRWVAKRGFLPARLPMREIRLTGKEA